MRIAFVERTKYYLIAELDDLICSVSGEIWTDRVFDFLDIQVSWSQYHDLPAMKYWDYKKAEEVINKIQALPNLDELYQQQVDYQDMIELVA